PRRSNTSAIARPICGKSWSTRQVTNRETRGAIPRLLYQPRDVAHASACRAGTCAGAWRFWHSAGPRAPRRVSARHAKACPTLQRVAGEARMVTEDSVHDVIIIGAGHNGLVAAGYLARAGLRVLVLENRDVVGGACVTEEVWPGFRVSTAAYLASLLQPRVVEDLELERF